MRCLICFCLCLLALIPINAQEKESYYLEMQSRHAEENDYDITFRRNYFEHIILRTELSSDASRLQFLSGRAEELLNIRPAAEYNLGFSFHYKWLGIGFSFTPKFLLNTQNIEELNNSESLGLNFNFFYSDRWVQELGYSYYKGFFRAGPQRLVDLGAVVLDDTNLKTIQGSTFFIVNQNYSFRAHYVQTERQLKSVGSVIPRLRYSYSFFEPNFENLPNLEKVVQINSLDISAQIGYLYSLVYDQKWIVTLGLHPGIGYNYSVNQFDGAGLGSRTFHSTTLALDSEISVGYNDYRWFFGAAYNWRNYNYVNNQKNQFTRDFANFNIYLGYRFNDNKPMRNTLGWFEDNLGF